ncbi:GNAT family N-acetyltransferase [Paenibacillus sp. M1]|uniref:GNAT family N-acetyltransferase n=1 Tax=Paenibacillus haidiansis TaxID=1574488 RepID=A0ABU7VRQ0_9BACL
MIRLEDKDYGKVAEQLRSIPINTLFAQAVLTGQVRGTVYADNAENPGAFYIVNPYGMSLLFGKSGDDDFREALKNYLLNAGQARQAAEWLQAYPDEWNFFIAELAGSEQNRDRKITEYSRINFNFDRQTYESAASRAVPGLHTIVPTTKEMFHQLSGSVSPKNFWIDADEFLGRGKGFSLIEDGEAVSTAFGAFRIGEQLEIGIETAEQARGKGYAFHVSMALIEYCLRNGLEPVWSCRRENEASYLLAQKVGFVPTIRLPYYHLQA